MGLMIMDMWNWLYDCYNEGSLTIEDLEKVMKDDMAAKILWQDWTVDSNDFIEYVRSEVYPFIHHLRKKDRQ